MSSEYRDIMWSEGMFLRPHHFQFADRAADARLRQATEHLCPHNWGFKLLEIDTAAVSNHTFSVRTCRILMEDGLQLNLPGNLDLDRRSFREAVAGLEYLDVFLGVPTWRPDAANTVGEEEGGGQIRRYRPEETTVVDEHTGDDPSPLQIKRFRGRIFWGTEDMTGYDVMRIARIKQASSGAAVSLDPAYFPPALDIAVWQPLLGVCEDVNNGLAMANYALIRDFSDREFTELLGIPRGIEAVIKMVATNRHVASLDQMCKTPHMHPFLIYLELLRLGATLGIFRGKRTAPSFPDYRHDDLGKCFLEMKEIIDGLLDRIGTSTFIQRSFQLRNDRLEADLEESWITGHRLFYIGVKGEENTSRLDRNIARLKICAPSDFAAITQKRLGGLGCRRLRMVPSTLPEREGTHYLQINMEGPFWESIEEDRVIVIAGAKDLSYKFELFVV
jgi:type VI secretion system protein ImpJ